MTGTTESKHHQCKKMLSCDMSDIMFCSRFTALYALLKAHYKSPEKDSIIVCASHVSLTLISCDLYYSGS